MLLWLKAAIFTVVVPGTVTVRLPYYVLGRRFPLAEVRWGLLEALGTVTVVLGAAVYLWCLSDFVRAGLGIPAPVSHPKRLVVTGLYCYVRNPMYLGVLLVVLGEAAMFRAVPLFWYAVAWLVVVHLAVLVYEEPYLRARFGDSYVEYRRNVRRWLPGKPYTGGVNA